MYEKYYQEKAKLNEEQRKCVEYLDNPLLIIAGPGTGKTKVLTCKLGFLLIEKEISPKNILAATFTINAANEMKNRLLDLGIEKEKLPYISTLHALAARIIQQNIDISKWPAKFIVLNNDEKNMLVADALEDLNLNFGRKQKGVINNISANISFAKSNCLYPDEIKENPDFKKIYTRYQSLLSYNYAVDFDDLILEANKILKDNTTILDRYRDEAKYFLIDEYQDINKAQYILIKLLANKSKYLYACGDNHQSIYGFRGSNPFYINNFTNDFQNTVTKELTLNYRTPHHILEGALDVVKQNSDYTPKNIKCIKKNENKIMFLESSSELKEAKCITKRILSNNGKYGEFTILFPNFKITKHILKELQKNNVSFVVAGSKDNIVEKNIKNYLRVLLDHFDNLALRHCMKIKIERVYKKHIKQIRLKAEDQGKRIWDILEDYSGHDSRDIKEFVESINKLEPEEGKQNLIKMVDDIAKEIKSQDDQVVSYFKNIADSLSDKATLQEFVGEIKKIERENIGIAETGEQDITKNAVSVMSIFRAKGLQNKIIFIVGMLKGIFPKEPIKDIDEQRRICYVAMTRAEEELFICYSTRHKGPGSLSSEIFFNRCPFLDHIDPKHVEKI